MLKISPGGFDIESETSRHVAESERIVFSTET